MFLPVEPPSFPPPEDGICHNLAAAARADCYEPVQGTQLLEEVAQMGYQPSGRILVQLSEWRNVVVS